MNATPQPATSPEPALAGLAAPELIARLVRIHTVARMGAALVRAGVGADASDEAAVTALLAAGWRGKPIGEHLPLARAAAQKFVETHFPRLAAPSVVAGRAGGLP